MLERLTNDEVSDVAAMFEQAGRIGLEFYRLLKNQPVEDSMLPQLLAVLRRTNPFVFKGEISDLSWFWNMQNEMSYSEFIGYSSDLKDKIIKNFEDLERDGYVKIDNENKCLILTQKGRTQIYDKNFVEVAVKANFETSLTCAEMLEKESERQRERNLIAKLDNLPATALERENMLHEIMKDELNTLSQIVEQKVLLGTDEKEIAQFFYDKVENLNNKILLHTVQADFPPPTGQLKDLQKVLVKLTEEMSLKETPLAELFKMLEKTLGRQTTSLNPAIMIRKGFEIAGDKENYIVSKDSPKEFVKIYKDENFCLQMDYSLNGQVIQTTAGKDVAERFIAQNAILEKVQLMQKPMLKSTINFDDNILDTDAEIQQNAAKQTHQTQPQIVEETALSPDKLNRGGQLVEEETETKLAVAVSAHEMKDTVLTATEEVTKVTEKAVKQAAKVSGIADTVATGATGALTGGIGVVVKVGKEILSAGIKAISQERTH